MTTQPAEVRAKDWKVMSWMALFAEERAWGGGGVSKTFGMVLKVSAVPLDSIRWDGSGSSPT